MSRFFAMLVSDAVAAPRIGKGLVLTGPIIGKMPAVNSRLTVRGAFGPPQRARFMGVGGVHRADSLRPPLVLVEGLHSTPARYLGAIVYEEGALFRVFSALLKKEVPYTQIAAKYETEADQAWGFVQAEGRVVDMFVVGGGVAEGETLWTQSTTITTLGEIGFDVGDALPIGEGWAVYARPAYKRHSTTAFIATNCGPAEQEMSVLMLSGGMVGEVLNQQRSNGFVQFEVPSSESESGAIMMASPSMVPDIH